MHRRGSHLPWPPGWRRDTWNGIGGTWDLLVVGGGITGAGIFSAAAHMGLRVLLVEQGDIASGTSSRSSKLVHGGFRYLKQGRINLTRQSVRERQHLLKATPRLVETLPFLYALYARDRVKPWMVNLGLAVYTRLARETGGYERLRPGELSELSICPDLQGLVAAFRYRDAQTDDARLVLRVITDGLIAGRGRAAVLSYARVTNVVHSGGRVRAAVVQDIETDSQAEVSARVVVNATGAWADDMRQHVGARPQLRPLRGSHLFFEFSTLPIVEAVAFMHPRDGRPVFACPWEGVSLVGTTDVAHRYPLTQEPSISEEEAEYLLEGIRSIFPDCRLRRQEVISSQSGVRPVVDTGKTDPSAESREHVLVAEQGLVSVIGGKLTTFRSVAFDALRAAHELDPTLPNPRKDTPVLATHPVEIDTGSLDSAISNHLVRRYGYVPKGFAANDPEALRPIPGTPYFWGELLWSAQHEGVVHLSDLLLRRFRCGILLRDGGYSLLSQLEKPISVALSWDALRWKRETECFLRESQVAHGLPGGWKVRD